MEGTEPSDHEDLEQYNEPEYEKWITAFLEWITFEHLSIAMSTFNILLHLIGIYLLVRVYLSKKNTQKLYLINLAFTELFWNIICCGYSTFNAIEMNGILQKYKDFKGMLSFDEYRHNGELSQAFHNYDRLLFFYDVGGWLYWLAMFALTADRLYLTTFPFHYRSYWTLRKSKILIGISYVLVISLQLCIYLLTNRETRLLIRIYSGMILSVLFLIFSLVSYVLIFIVFVKSKRRSQPMNNSISVWRSFTKSNFSLTLFLIGSCLILAVIPYIIWFWKVRKLEGKLFRSYYRFQLLLNYASHTYLDSPCGAFGPPYWRKRPKCLDYYINSYFYYHQISILLSSTTDAILYFFMMKEVRNLLIETFCCCLKRIGSTQRNELIKLRNEVIELRAVLQAERMRRTEREREEPMQAEIFDGIKRNIEDEEAVLLVNKESSRIDVISNLPKETCTGSRDENEYVEIKDIPDKNGSQESVEIPEKDENLFTTDDMNEICKKYENSETAEEKNEILEINEVAKNDANLVTIKEKDQLEEIDTALTNPNKKTLRRIKIVKIHRLTKTTHSTSRSAMIESTKICKSDETMEKDEITKTTETSDSRNTTNNCMQNM